MPALYRELIERAGLDFAAAGPEIDINDRAMAARAMHPTRGSEYLFRELLVPSLTATYAAVLDATGDADLLVTHPAGLTGPVVANQRQMLWASSVLAPMSFFSRFDPMVPPPAPWVHRLLASSPAVAGVFLQIADRLTARWAEPVQRLRAAHGLPPSANPIIAGQHSPHLVLAMFSRVLASPQPDWPPQARVTGPVLYNGQADDGLSAEIEAFLADGPAPIVFTLGTSAVTTAGRFYDVSAAAAQRLGRRAVLLVGPFPENRPPDPSPLIHVAEFAPHAALFSRAAAIVHQGGAGTLHQALASGKPMLVVPHAHDQPDNARRAAAAGVARVLYPRRYRVAALVRELTALLAPGQPYIVRASEVGAEVRREDGAAGAADAIDRLLTSAGRRH